MLRTYSYSDPHVFPEQIRFYYYKDMHVGRQRTPESGFLLVTVLPSVLLTHQTKPIAVSMKTTTPRVTDMTTACVVTAPSVELLKKKNYTVS
jgi:hypothetical protein